MRSAIAREVPQHVFATAWQDGAYVVDVREPREDVGGQVPGARLIRCPPSTGRGRPPATAPSTSSARAATRSMRAVDALAAAGIEAVSVAGGTSAWQSACRPVVGAQVA